MIRKENRRIFLNIYIGRKDTKETRETKGAGFWPLWKGERYAEEIL